MSPGGPFLHTGEHPCLYGPKAENRDDETRIVNPGHLLQSLGASGESDARYVALMIGSHKKIGNVVPSASPKSSKNHRTRISFASIATIPSSRDDENSRLMPVSRSSRVLSSADLAERGIMHVIFRDMPMGGCGSSVGVDNPLMPQG